VLDGEFNEPRLAQVYEVLCLWGESDQFFLNLANEAPASDILDLGCGTGQITLNLARAGHTVTGVDPALASLEVARQKPDADRVTWIHGRATDVPTDTFDLALMTNHVAQFLTGDDEWMGTLVDVHRALKPGGRLVFDSRDPAARGWEHWNPIDTRKEVALPDDELLLHWGEVTALEGENVTFALHYMFSTGTKEFISRSTLRFRPEQTLCTTLAAAGFDIEHIYGGWQHEPVGQGNGEFIIVARSKA